MEAENLIARTDHQLINATNMDVEYYTPVEIVEAARRVIACCSRLNVKGIRCIPSVVPFL